MFLSEYAVQVLTKTLCMFIGSVEGIALTSITPPPHFPPPPSPPQTHGKITLAIDITVISNS